MKFWSHSLHQYDDVRNVKATAEVFKALSDYIFSLQTKIFTVDHPTDTRKDRMHVHFYHGQKAWRRCQLFLLSTLTFSHYVTVSVAIITWLHTSEFVKTWYINRWSIETNCWWKSYRQPPETSLMKFSSVGRTMRRLDSSCTSNSGAASSCNFRIYCSRLRHVATQQPGPRSRWLTHLESETGTDVRVYRTPTQDGADLWQRLISTWVDFQYTKLLTSGEIDSTLVFVHEEVVSSSCSDIELSK